MDLRNSLLSGSAAGLLACASEANSLPPPRVEAPHAPISTEKVTQASACIREKFIKLGSGTEATLNPAPFAKGFFHGARQETGAVIAITWYLNRREVKKAVLAGTDLDVKGLFTEVGMSIGAQLSELEERPYKEAWGNYCVGAQAEDFYRSAFLVGPAFGLTELVSCLPQDQRCGGF